MNSLKNLIINSLSKINFKYLKIIEPDKKFLNLLRKEIKKCRKNKYYFKIDGLHYNDLPNFIFFSRVLDFRLWEFPKNWCFKNKKGYWGLIERLKILFKQNIKKIKFKDFRKIISPKENFNLAKLRFKLFKSCLNWLDQKYNFYFENYFEENKEPYIFVKKLIILEKFRDFINNFYFFKPNQLLYFEYILGTNRFKNFKDELTQLTVFADLDLFSVLNNFKILELKDKNLFYNKTIRKNSIKEIEIRGGAILACEFIRDLLKTNNSYEIDNALWNLGKKIKLKKLKIKSIFY